MHYQFFQEQVLIAKSIDLLGNPVYSVSCERARGVVWTGRLISLFSIRFEDTASFEDTATIVHATTKAVGRDG